MSVELLDTHAHLSSPKFEGVEEEVLRRAKESGVIAVIDPGCDLASSRRAVGNAKRFEGVYAAVGFHPSRAAELDERALRELRKLARHEKVVAIGEVGLDLYRYGDIGLDIQLDALRRQLELAAELGLPCIVHCREGRDVEPPGPAFEALLRLLSEEFPEIKGVMHCFSGTAELALKFVELGWMIGITGVVTFPNARRTQRVAMEVAMGALLIETDSPYLAPLPMRGRTCEPWMVKFVAQKVASLKGASVEELGRKTTENARRLFNLRI